MHRANITFHIFHGPELLRKSLTECFPIAEVHICLPRGGFCGVFDSNDNERNAGTMVNNLGYPPGLDIEELCFASYHGKDEKEVSLRIRQRSQSVVVLLSGSIEKPNGVRIVINPKRV